MGAVDNLSVADPAARRDWKPEYREYRHLILGLLESLQIRYFDLLEPLHKALTDGVIVAETGDNLFWHPSREVALYFSNYLRTQHFLDGAGFRNDLAGYASETGADV